MVRAVRDPHDHVRVYAVIFIMLLVLGISMPLKGNARRVCAAAAPVAIGWGLACYYLWPALTTPLRTGSFANPYSTNWLTPLFTLLSPVSIAPEPQPGRLSQHSPGLHTSVGWVILIGVGYVAYATGRTDQSSAGVCFYLHYMKQKLFYLATAPSRTGTVAAARKVDGMGAFAGRTLVEVGQRLAPARCCSTEGQDGGAGLAHLKA